MNKIIKKVKTITPDEEILICAVRYALGRRSYIVGNVIQFVFYKRKLLSKPCRDVIVRDIYEERDRYHAVFQTLGMEQDEKQWMELAEALAYVDCEIAKEEQVSDKNNKPILQNPGFWEDK